MNKKFEGIMPALVTPLKEDNVTINEEAAKKLIEIHLGQGADGFYVLGGTGEGLILSKESRMVMIEAAVSAVGGRKPVINHVASMNFNEAIELAKHSEKIGADAIAAVPPSFFGYNDDELYNYYKKLAESVHIPLVIYYHPSAQKNMSAKLIARIFEIDNVTGVKWSSNNFFEMMKLKDITHGEMNIINGPDELLISGLAAGADAGIGSTYNIMLPQFKEIYRLFKEGKLSEALEVQMKVNNVIDLMLNTKLIPSVKKAVGFMGVDVGDGVFPNKIITDNEALELAKKLKEFGWPFK